MTTLSFPISKIVNGTLLHLRTTASGSLTPDSPHPRYSPPRPPHPTTFHSRYQRLHLPLSAEHVVLHPQLAHSPVIASRAMDSPRTQSTLSNSPLPPLPHRRVSNPLRYSSEHSHPLSPPRRNDIGGGSGSSSARRDADITVPEWQPDAAAKQCPICTSAFTFFNRRHHCRKCGRVVCATCSPHRITIPSAYVVRPPPIPVIDLTSSSPGRRTSWILPPDSDGDSNDGSEGSSVRICEDCITPSPVETPTSRNRRRRQSTQGSRSAPPQFQETDYCPICHRALPYLPDPSEQGREAHVASCLAPLTRGRSYTNGGRMVVWNAGAKDTIDPTTGDPIECVICFEEFEEGTEIARLECFCRYHKKCIRDWFDRKGNGECPVHAVHE